MQVHWTIWSDATSEKSARNVAKRLTRELGREAHHLTFVLYPKTGGWTFSFDVLLEGESWSDYVVDAIALGQRIGYEWTSSRDVTANPEGWSTRSRISGITAAQWQLWRQDPSDSAAGQAGSSASTTPRSARSAAARPCDVM
jgi:hypothetical protein